MRVLVLLVGWVGGALALTCYHCPKVGCVDGDGGVGITCGCLGSDSCHGGSGDGGSVDGD